MISLTLSSTFFSGSAFSPSAFMQSPMIIATTTTAKILLLLLNAAAILDGTAFTSGLNASSVAASVTASLGSVTLKNPADFTAYATIPAKNAPHT